jgi:hypothetical protein
MVGDPKKSRTSLIADFPFFSFLDVLFWSGYQSQVISIHINPIDVVFGFCIQVKSNYAPQYLEG